MILKALTLENFKGIREPVQIEFAPLTLLFGPNNAGKSTVVQALIYAREVFERQNCDAGRTLLGGDVIDLGGFANLVYGHDLTRAIRMRFDLDLRGPGNRLTNDSDWVRENELENTVDQFYSNAPKKLDTLSAASAPARLVDVWVEIQIAWSDARQCPVIRTYSVGTKGEAYAVISYDDQKDETSLSYFNFGVYPFGTRYRRGDATYFDWALACITRSRLRDLIRSQGLTGIAKKGAQIGMRDQDAETTAKFLSRQDFDSLTSDFVRATGRFAAFASEETSGGRWRQEIVESAQLVDEIRSAPPYPEFPPDFDWFPVNLSELEQNRSDIEDVENAGQVESDESILTKNSDVVPEHEAPAAPSADEEDRDDCFEDRIERISGGKGFEDEELDSWMLEFFVALVRDGCVPTSEEGALPLKQRQSALPDLKRTLEIDPRFFLPEKWSDFWEHPVFAQEYFKDLLTTVIVRPGMRLLSVLQSAIYVSPFREVPPRHYQPARSPEPRRWANGLAAWDWIMLKDKEFASSVNRWLSRKDRFDSGFAIDLRHYHELEVDSWLLSAETDESKTELSWDWLRQRLRETPQGRRLQIKDLRSGVTLFPQDLGVGISQVVPVIVAALHTQSGIVMIEEPESNIHPAFQVVLADLFITQAKANPDLLFLVETHSEHLMLRCLRRIRETTEAELAEGDPSLRPQDIAVHFVEPSEGGPRIHRIRIDQDGEFRDPWPQGFFRERTRELYGDDL